jgi:hypothetical protein
MTVLAALLLAACGEDDAPVRADGAVVVVDAGADATPLADAAVDAGLPDANVADAGPDAGADGGAALLPNLKLLPDRIVPTIHPLLDITSGGPNGLSSVLEFGPNSCSVAEGMAVRGKRWLLRFDTATMNDGPVDLFLGKPPANGVSNEMFEWATCHGHHHFTGYAQYELTDLEGNVVVKNNGTETVGRKMAFCLENTDHIDPDSPTPSNAPDCVEGDTAESKCNYTCKFQGISSGWADTYWKTLAGQWIDICDVPSGMYRLRISINPEQRLVESDYTDNVFETDVFVPVMPGTVAELCVPVE